MGIGTLGIDRPPSLTSPHSVDHHNMGVNLRVVGSGGEVIESRRDIALRLQRASREPSVSFSVSESHSQPRLGASFLHVVQRFANSALVSCRHLPPNMLITERVQQRHRLGGRERMVERGDLAMSSRHRHRFAVRRFVVHQTRELFRVDRLAGMQSDTSQSRAHPPRWRLVTGVAVDLSWHSIPAQHRHVLTD